MQQTERTVVRHVDRPGDVHNGDELPPVSRPPGHRPITGGLGPLAPVPKRLCRRPESAEGSVGGVDQASGPKALADGYIKENFSIIPVDMDNSEDSMKTGIRLYNDKNFTQALQVFEQIIQTDTASTDAKKFAGIVSLQLKEYDKAISYFEELENYRGLEVNPGKLYHAIVLMERNGPQDREQAKNLLNIIVRLNLTGSKKAKAWLTKL